MCRSVGLDVGPFGWVYGAQPRPELIWSRQITYLVPNRPGLATNQDAIWLPFEIPADDCQFGIIASSALPNGWSEAFGRFPSVPMLPIPKVCRMKLTAAAVFADRT